MTKFSINVLKIASGTAIAQCIGILITPILTRIYNPEAFGLMAIYTSIISVIGVVVCLRYENAIMLPKLDEEAANVFAVCISSTAIITIICSLFCVFLESSSFRLINDNYFTKYLWIIPIGVFFSGLCLVLNSWNTRIKDYNRLSFTKVVSSLCTQGSKLLFGLLGYASGGILIGSTIFGNTSSVMMLSYKESDRNICSIVNKVKFKNMLITLERYRKFPLFNMGAILIDRVATSLPNWLLALYFSPATLGYYALGKMAIGIPINMIGESLAQVFYQRATEITNVNGDISLFVDKVIRYLIMFTILPILLLSLIGKEVFEIFFGPGWSEAGIYAQILCPTMFLDMIYAPIKNIFNILEIQSHLLLFNILYFVSSFIALYAGSRTNNVLLAIVLFSISSTIVSYLTSSWLLYKIRLPFHKLFYYVFKYGFYCLPFLAIVIISKCVLHLHSIVLILLTILCCSIYYIIILNKFRVFNSRAFKQKHLIDSK